MSSVPGPAPTISIVLPAYNRADTIDRALDSVQAQTRDDWELVVVDDGSKDDTADRVAARGDARIRLIRQPNGGVASARNTALAASRGRLITFLDSDDAWLPDFLALTAGFLEAEPDRQFVLTEFDQDRGDGRPIRPNIDGIEMYAAFARSIGSRALAMPDGESDTYLRVYATREPLGDWARPALQARGQASAWLYRGDLFPAMRWGYLAWLPATMMTRHALETIGPFRTGVRTAEDYLFLGRLAQSFPASLVGLVAARKHERGVDASRLGQDHLATGANAFAFELNKMTHFRELYADEFARDPELALILRHYQLYTGLSGLMAGRRREAMPHLRAAACWKPHLRRAWALLALAHLLPSDRLMQRTMQAGVLATGVLERLASGEMTLADLAGKLAG